MERANRAGARQQRWFRRCAREGNVTRPINKCSQADVQPEPGVCKYCGIQTHGTFCDVCEAMVNAVRAQPGLAAAQAEYEAENERRIRIKSRLERGET